MSAFDVILDVEGPFQLVQRLPRLSQHPLLLVLSLLGVSPDVAQVIVLRLPVLGKQARHVVLLAAQLLDVAVLLLAEVAERLDLVVVALALVDDVGNLGAHLGDGALDLVALLAPVRRDGVVAALHELGVRRGLLDVRLGVGAGLLHLGLPGALRVERGLRLLALDVDGGGERLDLALLAGEQRLGHVGLEQPALVLADHALHLVLDQLGGLLRLLGAQALNLDVSFEGVIVADEPVDDAAGLAEAGLANGGIPVPILRVRRLGEDRAVVRQLPLLLRLYHADAVGAPAARRGRGVCVG